jgi:putative membrane protein
MIEFLTPFYLWFKALHIIAVISWIAGLLYLPRLFVYHAESETGSDKSETFKVMEERLVRFIMRPAMGATWFFGLLLIALNSALLSAGWLHAKLLFVVVLTGMHHVFDKWRKRFKEDKNEYSAKFFKVWNEAPTAVMVAIVVLVVVKPF